MASLRRQRAPYGRVWPWAVHRTFPPAARRRGLPQRPDRPVGWADRSRAGVSISSDAASGSVGVVVSSNGSEGMSAGSAFLGALRNRAIRAWAMLPALARSATSRRRFVAVPNGRPARRGLSASAAPSTDCSYGCVTTLGRSAARAWPAPRSEPDKSKYVRSFPHSPPGTKAPSTLAPGCLPAWGRHSGAGNLAGCIWLIGCTGDRAGVVQQKIGPGGCHSKQPGDPLTAPRAVADRRWRRRCKCLWSRGWWGLEYLEIRDTALGFC